MMAGSQTANDSESGRGLEELGLRFDALQPASKYIYIRTGRKAAAVSEYRYNFFLETPR